MSQDEEHSGIPTRAIHEAYLDMQRALKAYREAKDKQHSRNIGEAHGELQQAVLTCYELLRPHMRSEQALRGYWMGELPEYTGNMTPPDPDNGKGILQVQKKNDQKAIGDIDPSGFESFRDWHKHLNFNGNKRIIGIMGMGDDVFVTVHEYQLGLRQMDDWETKYKRNIKRKSGFMSDKREEQIERQRIPIDRLKNAARELSNVANELTLLSDVTPGGSDIIRNFDQSGDEPQGEFDSVDYSGSPDL